MTKTQTHTKKKKKKNRCITSHIAAISARDTRHPPLTPETRATTKIGSVSLAVRSPRKQQERFFTFSQTLGQQSCSTPRSLTPPPQTPRAHLVSVWAADACFFAFERKSSISRSRSSNASLRFARYSRCQRCNVK